MKKTNFNNTFVLWVITIILSGLILWNLYLIIAHSRLLGFIPVLIQSVLLILILKKNQYAKEGMKIWVVLFLIIAPGLQFAGGFIKDLTDNFINVDFPSYLENGITIIVGTILFLLINKTVEIVENEKASTYPG